MASPPVFTTAVRATRPTTILAFDSHAGPAAAASGVGYVDERTDALHELEFPDCRRFWGPALNWCMTPERARSSFEMLDATMTAPRNGFEGVYCGQAMHGRPKRKDDFFSLTVRIPPVFDLLSDFSIALPHHAVNGIHLGLDAGPPPGGRLALYSWTGRAVVTQTDVYPFCAYGDRSIDLPHAAKWRHAGSFPSFLWPDLPWTLCIDLTPEADAALRRSNVDVVVMVRGVVLRERHRQIDSRLAQFYHRLRDQVMWIGGESRDSEETDAERKSLWRVVPRADWAETLDAVAVDRLLGKDGQPRLEHQRRFAITNGTIAYTL